MIPKIIHYCWFGNKSKPDLVLQCIKSWKKYLPDYEIKEWNDENLKNCDNLYVQEALKQKKWAFISDYFRLYALYNYGGIYFDTDNEIFKSFDEFLNLDFFSGYENWNGYISPFTAVVGAKKGHKIIKELLDQYNYLHFIEPDGSLNLYTNTRRVTDYFQRKYDFIEPYDENELKILEKNCIIYPSNIFCRYEKNISYAVHHFNGSWVPAQRKYKPTFLQQLFSITNSNDKKHKIVRLFGFKIAFKKTKYSSIKSDSILTANECLFKLLKDYSFNTVLDLGAGEGLHSKIFNEHNKKVTAIVGDGTCLFNQDNFKDIELIQKDFLETNFKTKYDCVWASHILEHQLNIGLFLDKIFDVLNDDGYLALTVPPFETVAGGGHLYCFTPSILIYHLILHGFDLTNMKLKQYDMNLSIICKKQPKFKKLKNNISLDIFKREIDNILEDECQKQLITLLPQYVIKEIYRYKKEHPSYCGGHERIPNDIHFKW